MIPGYEEPFKWWFDFHLFSELDSAKASKEREKKDRERIADWVANRIQMSTFIFRPRETCNSCAPKTQRCAVGEMLLTMDAFFLPFPAALSLCPGEDKA